MTDPCKDCPERQTYARLFDMHFWGSDCPYICEERNKYDELAKTQKEDYDGNSNLDHSNLRTS